MVPEIRTLKETALLSRSRTLVMLGRERAVCRHPPERDNRGRQSSKAQTWLSALNCWWSASVQVTARAGDRIKA